MQGQIRQGVGLMCVIGGKSDRKFSYLARKYRAFAVYGAFCLILKY